MSVALKNSDTDHVVEPPLLTGNQTFSSITEKISSLTEHKTPKPWFFLIGMSSFLALIMFSLIYLALGALWIFLLARKTKAGIEGEVA